jgi:hypothetical protein
MFQSRSKISEQPMIIKEVISSEPVDAGLLAWQHYQKWKERRINVEKSSSWNATNIDRGTETRTKVVFIGFCNKLQSRSAI